MTDRIVRFVDVDDPKPGDIATHKNGELDPRSVTKVEGDSIWLFILINPPYGPLPKDNYTYKRPIVEVK